MILKAKWDWWIRSLYLKKNTYFLIFKTWQSRSNLQNPWNISTEDFLKPGVAFWLLCKWTVLAPEAIKQSVTEMEVEVTHLWSTVGAGWFFSWMKGTVMENVFYSPFTKVPVFFGLSLPITNLRFRLMKRSKGSQWKQILNGDIISESNILHSIA